MKLSYRLLCVTIALLSIISTVIIPSSAVTSTSYTPEDGMIRFDSQAKVDKFIKASNYTGASNGVKYSYDKEANALKIEVTGGDPWVYINCYDNMSSKFYGRNINYCYIVYKALRSNSNAAQTSQSKVYLCTQTSPTPTDGDYYAHWSFNPIFSNQYTIGRLDIWSRIEARGYFYGFRYDFFQNASVGDIIYIDSIILDNSKIPGVYVAGERTAALNGYPIDPSSDLFCRGYDVDKYMSPFWKGNIVYNEAVCPMENDDGSYTYTLMYEPDEIIYVYDGEFSRYFTEGVDFTVSGNKLTVLPNGNIDRFTLSNQYGDHIYFQGYLNVTYTHSDTWDYYVPQSKADDLPNTSSAIKNNENYNLVFFGDSLTGGANASKYRGFFPNAPYWWEQIEDALRENYGHTNLNVYDIGEGGKKATEMIDYFKSNILPYNPDLLFIEFGVNDAQVASSNGDSVSSFKSNFKNALNSMITAARAKNSECEIVLVAPFYSQIYNYDDAYFEACRDACLELEDAYNGVVCVNMTDLNGSLFEVKRHFDLTGDNVCHPNDYMSRFFAQASLATIIPEELGYEAYVPESLKPTLSIDSITPTSANINLLGKATFSATVKGDGVTFDWDTSSLPAGVTVSGDTSAELTVSFDKAIEGDHTYEVSLTVSDRHGNSVTSEKLSVNYEGYKKGDIDGDNEVSPLDYFQLKLILAQKIQPTEAQKAAGNVDGSESVMPDMLDSFAFKFYLAKGYWAH